MTALFVVNGALLISTVAGGGFIAVQLLKKTRKSSRVPEYDDTYVPLPGIDILVRLDSSTNSKTDDATKGHVYETINYHIFVINISTNVLFLISAVYIVTVIVVVVLGHAFIRDKRVLHH